MSLFNQPDFFMAQPLDLENKLIIPTVKLHTQASLQLNTLYENIRNLLIEAHTYVATLAKQVYAQPVETLAAWYGQAAYTATTLYADAQSYVLPIYQQWGTQFTIGKEQAGQFLQAFWRDPEQVTLAALAPLKAHVATATTYSEQYLQPLLDNPEQFLWDALAPINNYLNSFTESAESILIGTYYALLDLFKLLMAQPSETVRALYQNSLSALLDVYFDAISSLLTMV